MLHSERTDDGYVQNPGRAVIRAMQAWDDRAWVRVLDRRRRTSGFEDAPCFACVGRRISAGKATLSQEFGDDVFEDVGSENNMLLNLNN